MEQKVRAVVITPQNPILRDHYQELILHILTSLCIISFISVAENCRGKEGSGHWRGGYVCTEWNHVMTDLES